MLPEKFNRLTLKQRTHYLRKNGTYLRTRNVGPCSVSLYRLEYFYAELWMGVRGYEIYTFASLDDLESIALYVHEPFGKELLL